MKEADILDSQFGYYTTNLNYDELNERYGERVMDRLRETCYFLILEDTSFRKLSTAEQINEDLQ
jgi:DNA replication protein DnaC